MGFPKNCCLCLFILPVHFTEVQGRENRFIFFRGSENCSLLILDTFSDKHFSDIQVSAKVEAILYLQAIAVLGNASIGFPKDCNFRKAVMTTDQNKISYTLQISLLIMAHLDRNDRPNTRWVCNQITEVAFTETI